MSSLTKFDLSATTKKAVTLLDEFKAFAFKGNVVDLAIGVIIGGAFHQIIDSLVKNIIMPLIDVVVPGDKPYTHWGFTLHGKSVHIGLFLGDILHFLITAAVLFLFLVKFLGWLMKSEKAEAQQPPPLSKDQELLTEIRDLLRSQQTPAA
jgi:large conductance mechanosensitive channel